MTDTMTLHGCHFVAGRRVGAAQTFASSPATGPAREFSIGTPALVAEACQAAALAFPTYAATTRGERATFLEAIAEEIEARGPQITEIGTQETGLPAGRLEGERGRTTGQLRLFAQHIRQGDYLDRRHDPALPERSPAARPELFMMQRPIGPVAVFGASNFPLAFSVAGGDTAAALAAGCPVVVKGHSAHPGTGEVVAEAILAAIARTGMPAGVFSLIQGGNRKVGESLVTHPAIKAVGFTGSLVGGRALFDLCAARPEPIPFFGELGSVNPVFVLPSAAKSRGDAIAREWAASLTLGAGQFCTNPGIVVLPKDAADGFAAAAMTALDAAAPQVMLTDGIASAFHAGRARVGAINSVEYLLATPSEGRLAAPQLFRTSAENWLANEELAEEVFGPLGLLVTVESEAECLALAQSLKGQLTCTIQLDDADAAFGLQLLAILEHKAGRVLANGFPTGVEVADTMVHGGPYPASTNFGATSVGTLSIRRFLRPVCYQNLPRSLWPDDLTASIA